MKRTCWTRQAPLQISRVFTTTDSVPVFITHIITSTHSIIVNQGRGCKTIPAASAQFFCYEHATAPTYCLYILQHLQILIERPFMPVPTFVTRPWYLKPTFLPGFSPQVSSSKALCVPRTLFGKFKSAFPDCWFFNWPVQGLIFFLTAAPVNQW